MLDSLKTLVKCLLPVMVAVGCGGQPDAPAAAPDGFAIQNVTVVDVRTGGTTAGQTVLVRGNQIAQVGAVDQVQIPAGTSIVNGQGRYVIPGVWDMHVHATRFPQRALPLAITRGITAVRDMGADISKVDEVRSAVASGAYPSPRLVLAGEGLEGVPGQRPGNPPNTVLDTPEKGRAQVQKLAAVKVDFLKAHTELQPPVYAAIMDEAKKFNLPVDGHLQPGMTITQAADAGQRTIEHLDGLQQACAARPAQLGRGSGAAGGPIQLNAAKCAETAKYLASKGTWITPTIGAPGSGDARGRQFELAITKIAFDNGVRLLAGTDYNGAGYPVRNYNGTNANVMDELAGLVEAGLTPVQALQTATVNPSILFRRESELGSVEAGKLADLLVLEGNPTADIANMKRIAAVVLNGRLIDAAEIQKMIDDEAAWRAQQAESAPAQASQSRP